MNPTGLLFLGHMHIALAIYSEGNAEDEAVELFYKLRRMRIGLPCRAWSDPKYKALMLKDGASAAAELGIEADGWPPNGGVTGE